MLTEKEMLDRMKNGWRGGKGDGTICGQGSMRRNTRSAVSWLPKIVEKYNIKSVGDAGAGDLHWIGDVEWDVEYKPYDLFPRKSIVRKLDITTELMEPCDAVLCRFVLNHLVDGEDNQRVTMAIDNFRKVAGYLIATNFEGGENRVRSFTRLDLRDYLGEPLESVVDGHEEGCNLSLWTL